MLGKMQILTHDTVVFSSVERQPFAYVVYDLEYQKNIAIVKSIAQVQAFPWLAGLHSLSI